MQTYLQNLLPRVKQFSQTLDQKELLIDQPWVLLDEEGNKQQYIFERDGRLVMAYNGQVQYGKWKYMQAANSLLIDRANDSVLLNHRFFSAGICLLKKDGFVEDPWMLVNQNIVPDLDGVRYLKSLLPEYKFLKPLQVKETILFYKDVEGNGITKGSLIFNSDYQKADGTFQADDQELFYDVENGIVKRIFRKLEYKTDKGILVVEVNKFAAVSKGNPCYLKDGSKANGLYKIIKDDTIKTVMALDGNVKQVKRKIKYSGIILILFLIWYVLLMIYLFFVKKS